MSILDKFLEIDSDETLYQYTFSYKNTLMYPFIRYFLLQNAKENILKMPSAYDPIHFGTIHKYKYYIKSFWHRPPKHLQSDIVFFGSDTSNIRQGNMYFNRLTEFFANEYPSKTILIELSNKMDYKRPRTYPKVFSKDYVDIRATIKSKWKSVNSKDLLQIDSFLHYLKQQFNHEFSDSTVWNEIKNTLVYNVKILPRLFEEYTKLLKRISPKVIFLEDACYGGSNIPLMMAAKELNIPIGEYQHGFISLDHPAYNYSNRIPSSYKYYMPDFYMSYGKYWENNSRIPIKKIEVGNPNISNAVSQYVNEIKKEHILYISSVVYPERDVQEVIRLNKIMAEQGYLVMFRIHPSEIPRLQTVYKPVVDAGILIDTQPLYDTLKRTKYIIENISIENSSVENISTVLFEATMFDCIIFVIKTPLHKEDIGVPQFNCVQSVYEIAEVINSKNYIKTEPNHFWADDWRSKFRKLIDSYLL